MSSGLRCLAKPLLGSGTTERAASRRAIRVAKMNAAKLRATIERLEAVAADRDGPEADAYREKAAELRLELAVAEAAEGKTADAQQSMPLADIAKLTPAERAALEIELQQTFEILEAEKRAIHEWESELAREKKRTLRRCAAKAK